MRILIGLFLLAHGLVHPGLGVAPGNDGRLGGWLFAPGRAWLLRPLGFSDAAIRQVGYVLCGLAAVAFVLAGLAYLGWVLPESWWSLTAVAGSVLSLALLLLFWHPWLVMGSALNVTVLLAAIYRWAPAHA